MLGTLGPEEGGGQKSVAILNRRVSWLNRGLELAASPRHAEYIVKGMGLTKGPKSLDALGKERRDEEEGDSEEMTVARYCALAARANT